MSRPSPQIRINSARSTVLQNTVDPARPISTSVSLGRSNSSRLLDLESSAHRTAERLIKNNELKFIETLNQVISTEVDHPRQIIEDYVNKEVFKYFATQCIPIVLDIVMAKFRSIASQWIAEIIFKENTKLLDNAVEANLLRSAINSMYQALDDDNAWPQIKSILVDKIQEIYGEIPVVDLPPLDQQQFAQFLQGDLSRAHLYLEIAARAKDWGVFDDMGKIIFGYRPKTLLWHGPSSGSSLASLRNEIMIQLTAFGQQASAYISAQLQTAQGEEDKETRSQLLNYWRGMDKISKAAVRHVESEKHGLSIARIIATILHQQDIDQSMLPGHFRFKEHLDNNHDIFAIAGGLVVDCKTSRISPRYREHYCTFQSPLWYNEFADPAPFERLLYTLLCGNMKIVKCPLTGEMINRPPTPDEKARVEFLSYYLVYCMTGHTHIHLFLILIGHTRNGKSTLIKILDAIWGEYFLVADKSVFIGLNRKDTNAASPQIIQLLYRRLAAVIESDENDKVSSGDFNRMTGADKINARSMRQDNTTFHPTHKMLTICNTMPQFDYRQASIMERIIKLECNTEFKDNPDPNDPNQVQKVYGYESAFLTDIGKSGVLNYLLIWLAKWNANGRKIEVPECIKTVTNQLAEHSDTVLMWKDECVQTHKTENDMDIPLDDTNVVYYAAMRKSYEDWIVLTPYVDQKVTATKFSKDVAKHLEKYKCNDRRGGSKYKRLILKQSEAQTAQRLQNRLVQI